MDKNIIEEYVKINGIEQYFLHLPRRCPGKQSDIQDSKGCYPQKYFNIQDSKGRCPGKYSDISDCQEDSKDVIIMLHGGPGLANSYLAYFHKPYCDFCNLVYYDQRGAGKTQIKNQSSSESLSFEVLLEDLRQTILYIKSKYNTDRVFLAGHSWGSMLGTEYVLRFPNDVAGYIGYGQGVPGKRQDRHYYEFVKSEVLKSGNQEYLEILSKVDDCFPFVAREDYLKQYNVIAGIGFGSGYDFTTRDVFEIYASSPIWTNDDEQISETIEKLNENLYAQVLYDWKNDSKIFTVPIYFILGRHDEMTSSIIAAEYYEQIEAPKKGLYWIENAGHLIDTDNPIDFFAAIKDIISLKI